ncbi:hypothetical protein [Streptomyces sp. SID13726]|uniref:hypothetical protein n=1 Tax=Streptomyces sp. SID13726 TaxID=2706058 RepID=UPI001941D79D|nr:hypothetical protein [Streptomyces sp. SID13726]
MSADRENHDMSNGDIALLLADAADEVEIGIAPYESVIRGGRRRRARRWAVAAATALVLAGSSATLAVAGLPGGDGGRVAPAATQPGTPLPDGFETRPHRTTLASGTDDGKRWRVVIDVWDAPRDRKEADSQRAAMAERGESPEIGKASELVGKISYFVYRGYGDETTKVMENTVPKSDTMTGTDLISGSLPLRPDAKADVRLVIGYVARTAERVNCTWTNETATVVERAPAGTETASDDPVIRTPDGSPYDWFVCVAPKGAEYKSAEVIK